MVKDGEVFCSMPPLRHKDVIVRVIEHKKNPMVGSNFGFITSDGLFVDRFSAFNIAKEAGQIISDKRFGELTTEDLY